VPEPGEDAEPVAGREGATSPYEGVASSGEGAARAHDGTAPHGERLGPSGGTSSRRVVHNGPIVQRTPTSEQSAPQSL
jgi:hypothetical protein